MALDIIVSHKRNGTSNTRKEKTISCKGSILKNGALVLLTRHGVLRKETYTWLVGLFKQAPTKVASTELGCTIIGKVRNLERTSSL